MPEQPVPEPASLLADAPADAAVPAEAEVDSGRFTVRLTNFTGPFDLLLQLIGKHKLDVTEIALHQVTDDFIAYIRAMGDDWDLGETSEFLLVAATLLDLKAARLLPSAEVEDEEDLALLEARDLLFARLLQYKAYKEAAAVIADLEGVGARRWPRAVTLEARYAEALPDLVLGIGPERLLKLALKQFLPKPLPPEVSIAHIHQVRVSVREHATLIRDRLRRAGSATFSLLIADCENTLEVVARFLALLELYREGLIDFEQPVSLEEMTVRWIGGDQTEADLDIDDYEGTPVEPDTAALDPDAPADATLEAVDDDEDADQDADDLVAADDLEAAMADLLADVADNPYVAESLTIDPTASFASADPGAATEGSPDLVGGSAAAPYDAAGIGAEPDADAGVPLPSADDVAVTPGSDPYAAHSPGQNVAGEEASAAQADINRLSADEAQKPDTATGSHGESGEAGPAEGLDAVDGYGRTDRLPDDEEQP